MSRDAVQMTWRQKAGSHPGFFSHVGSVFVTATPTDPTATIEKPSPKMEHELNQKQVRLHPFSEVRTETVNQPSRTVGFGWFFRPSDGSRAVPLFTSCPPPFTKKNVPKQTARTPG